MHFLPHTVVTIGACGSPSKVYLRSHWMSSFCAISGGRGSSKGYSTTQRRYPSNSSLMRWSRRRVTLPQSSPNIRILSPWRLLCGRRSPGHHPRGLRVNSITAQGQKLLYCYVIGRNFRRKSHSTLFNFFMGKIYLASVESITSIVT